MKNTLNKIVMYTALNLVIAVPFANFAVAEQEKNSAPTSNIVTAKSVAPVVDKKLALTKHKLLVATQKQIFHEAKDAVLEIRKALVELDNKNAKIALAALKAASTNLDVVLKKNPNMAMLPVDIQVDIVDFNGDNNTISKATAEADKLLNNGQLQEARKILAVLASEMRTTTTSLPFGVLAEAVKKAQSLIEENTDEKTAEASVVLNDALNMLVETTDVMPLPILRAEGYLTEASIVEHTQDLKQEKVRENVLKFTDEAKTQLKQAELLGYGGKDDYQMLYKAIDEIKDTMASEKSAVTWDNIKKKLAELKSKLTFTKK
jgi:hypothetical protein